MAKLRKGRRKLGFLNQMGENHPQIRTHTGLWEGNKLEFCLRYVIFICYPYIVKIFLINTLFYLSGLPWWLSGKESACQRRRRRFDPWSGKITCKRKWQTTPVFLPGKSHEQKSLAGFSAWDSKSQTRLSTDAHTFMLACFHCVNTPTKLIFSYQHDDT